MCATLESYGLPETLHHDDFHGNNICAGDRGYLFFDWGESCVAHPFFTMVVTLRAIAYFLKLTGDAPELAELRDIYLEPWTKFMDRRDLDDVYDLANLVGMVNRALTWYRVVSGIPEPHKSEEAGSVPGWLLEFLEAQAKSPF
jgi:aminoglycoside phosphotransferase (APT) family kinase protein